MYFIFGWNVWNSYGCRLFIAGVADINLMKRYCCSAPLIYKFRCLACCVQFQFCIPIVNIPLLCRDVLNFSEIIKPENNYLKPHCI